MHDRSADRPLGAARRATRRRRVAGAALGLLTVAGLGVSTAQLLDARRAERSAAAAGAVAAATADATGDELVDRRTALVDAELELGAADERLASWLGDLYARLGERHTLTEEVAAMRAQLTQLRGAISGAEAENQATAALVAVLGTCLDGVTELLNQVSVGDQAGAARTVDRIRPACAAIGTVLG